MATSGQEGTATALGQEARETRRTLGVLYTQPCTPTQKAEQPLTIPDRSGSFLPGS